ncbi:carboxymuconolactone decarboxylase family protein [Hymenobacter terricola]|uniref:carboxymuconolactone decarboxylase family protein n=1 Tax=Hymenobacter terricola TaxID=2819236 RepID=UPI001B31629D|nr:carboxymuconolactone decarboxylase family protein [Hymenobacter terricola]
MNRLTALNPDTASGKTKTLFDAIHSKMGKVPNMMRTMGHAPALLEGYLSLSGALGGGTLGAKLGEQLALAISEANSCDYCLAAHSFIAEKMVRMDSAAIAASRQMSPIDTKTDAALTFAKHLVEKRGLVSEDDVAAVRAAGYTEGEVGEIVGHVALNILTNYFNNTAKPTLDFPAAAAL